MNEIAVPGLCVKDVEFYICEWIICNKWFIGSLGINYLHRQISKLLDNQVHTFLLIVYSIEPFSDWIGQIIADVNTQKRNVDLIWVFSARFFIFPSICLAIDMAFTFY